MDFKCALCSDKLEILVQDGAITRKEYYGMLSDIHQCTNCGHIQFYPLPKPEVLDNYYSSNLFYSANSFQLEDYYTFWLEGKNASQVIFIESLILLKAEYFARTEKPVLYDYACGTGGLVAKTSQLGFNSRGSEMDKVCVEFCQSKGLSVSQGGIELLAKENNLDIVTCYHSLEHFLNPQAFIDAVNLALNDNGFLVLAVPNGSYYPAQVDFFGKFDWSFFPEHLHYFTPNSIDNFLFKNNFEVISMTSNSVADTQLDWLHKCAIINNFNPSIPQVHALYHFIDQNLLARDLRVIARKTKNPKPLNFGRKHKSRLEEVSPGNINGIIFSVKEIDNSKATPKLVINVQANKKLDKDYKVLLHLRRKEDKNTVSDDCINLDFYPEKPTSTWGSKSFWRTKESFDLYVPLLLDNPFTCYQIEIGLIDTELSIDNKYILYHDTICMIGTLCI
ncbi:hypothetical protein PCC8801_1554 [Rippkaea orientalis PCC 8801]|uniref:Methyltransferase type 11 n=1 Tax=Rippkaea orientalis (strain PCC 8801 / RF-1) TaxID=41431 RepID=B7JUR3_RIPO1|nr:class I SAM-dependent methyltransferase [Rippkaea orientalis]ACK65607.1 hypothetical protein PCC8801_1554 [Rippkaea orientalis PCC 8801]